MTPTSAHPDTRATGAFVAHTPAFAEVLGDDPRLARIVSVDAHEGPVYAADEDALYFTTARTGDEDPLVSLMRLQLDGDRFPLEPERLTVIREDANAANGMALDGNGRLAVCEQGSLGERARISALDRVTGEWETVVDRWGELPLNSPNDVVVARDGGIWFTDPSYGFLQGFRPAPSAPDQVYRHDPRTGETTAVAAGFDKPNGLAFSPDERTLYVSDNGAPTHVVAFEVHDDGRLGPRRPFAAGTPGHPDGLKVDGDGRVYASATSGIHVFDPAGVLIGEIVLPSTVTFAFGGRRGDLLFVTTDAAVWVAHLGTSGGSTATTASIETPKGA